MEIPIYKVDAFTNKVFSGNPAAVCPLEYWLEDSMMQSIAKENNLSETAFFVRQASDYYIRWFTPEIEVDLCGHATLASAFVYFNYIAPSSINIEFQSRSGPLSVEKGDGMLSMNFPSQPPCPCAAPDNLVKALNIKPAEVLSSQDYFVVYENEKQIRELSPLMYNLKQIDKRGVIATAPGDEADFVSRCFFPRLGIDEDPVTGSAHSALIPYWSKRYEKKELHARQISDRGGELFCTNFTDRVIISGHAVMFMRGIVYI